MELYNIIHVCKVQPFHTVLTYLIVLLYCTMISFSTLHLMDIGIFQFRDILSTAAMNIFAVFVCIYIVCIYVQ